jgi:hypothetical protein
MPSGVLLFLPKVMESVFYPALAELADSGYADFQSKLIPTVAREAILGVRVPLLRALANSLYREHPEECRAFLQQCPHVYLEENGLHALLVCEMRDMEEALATTERFLPFISDWATCDIFSPKVFAKHPAQLLQRIPEWVKSEHTYTVRFGVGMLMQHFLGTDFRPEYPDWVAGVKHSDYYVRMMVAWYFATALAKQQEASLPYIEARRLEPWTHNKAIQKAIESRRIAPELKDYLRGLKV